METNRFLMFYQSFERVVKDIKRKEMSYMSEYGLRSVHLRCLLRINQSEKGMTITQLSKATNTDKALISRVVKELSNDGFLENKNAKEEKSYNKKYYLTEKSEKIASDISEDMIRYLAQAREGIPDEDMHKFYEILARLTQNISTIADSEE